MSPLPDSRTLARAVERVEAAAYADLARAAPDGLGFAVDETDDAVALYAAGVDAFLFNRVLALGVDRPADPARVAALLARYRALGVRHCGLAWSPSATPADFPDALPGLGLAHGDAWCKLARPADRPVDPAATDLVVGPVARADALRFGEVVCAGFGLPAGLAALLAALVGRPGWHAYVARAGDVPVAAAALFVRGEAGWVGVDATLPAARRRGAQTALLARRLADGAALGCRWFATETGVERPDRPNPSLHNLRRAGFEPVHERANWLVRTDGA